MFTVGGTGGPGLENTDLEQEYETQSTEGFSSARGKTLSKITLQKRVRRQLEHTDKTRLL